MNLLLKVGKAIENYEAMQLYRSYKMLIGYVKYF